MIVLALTFIHFSNGAQGTVAVAYPQDTVQWVNLQR